MSPLVELIGYIAIILFCSGFLIIGGFHLLQEITGRAPFIPISQDVLDDIVQALELSDTSIVYDLGSGDGRVVLAAAAVNTNAQAIGVERSVLPFVLSHFEKKRRGLTNARFVRANFFDVPVNEATHVFLYLLPGLMNSLLPKLEKELRPGTRVVTCDFRFKDKMPVKTIDLQRKKYNLGRKIHIYEF